MGWLYGWDTRKQLVDHLVANKGGGKVLKHCCVGNNLWMVVEYPKLREYTETGIVLCLLRGRSGTRDGWGYKDIDECMGPNETSCPVSYLEMCTAPMNRYAYEWRQRVYERGRNTRALKVGTKWKSRSGDGSIVEILERRSPSSFLVLFNGFRYKAGLSQLLGREQVI